MQYLSKDGSALSVVRAATLRQKLRFKIAIASRHRKLTPGLLVYK